MKIAILSNVNMDYIARLLKKDYEVWEPQGYGTLIEQLLNSNSSLNQFKAEVIIILPDLNQLIVSCEDVEEAKIQIKQWYQIIENTINNRTQYFLADALIHSEQILNIDEFQKEQIEYYFIECIQNLCQSYGNIHRLKVRDAVIEEGSKSCYSKQLWYTGKIIFSNVGCKIVAKIIKETIEIVQQIPKKVLALDLDNTLWGGVLGEEGIQGIEISDEKNGLIYREVQRLVKKIKNHGILITLVSKNNESDVKEAFEQNTNMILKFEDFIVPKINWRTKAENLLEISKELNLGLDSIVFIDDMEIERESVKAIAPMVEVPDFPNDIKQLPKFFEMIYNKYFKRLRGTTEDTFKTEQYKQNKERIKLEQAMDYETFLKSLNIEVENVKLDNDQVKERLFQILQKTNQFNTTTIRYSRQELQYKLQSEDDKIYLFRARDKFGDYGIIAAVIVTNLSTVPCIEDFAMSCRIMNKCVENYILDTIEKDLINMDKILIQAKYYKSKKNMPVEKLYNNLGYKCVYSNENESLYELNLLENRKRKYYVINT